jgi:hypothetical protein
LRYNFVYLIHYCLFSRQKLTIGGGYDQGWNFNVGFSWTFKRCTTTYHTNTTTIMAGCTSVDNSPTEEVTDANPSILPPVEDDGESDENR